MAYVIEPDGTTIKVYPKNGRNFSLEELYRHTKCDCIDLTLTVDENRMVVDDEGLLKGLPFNEKATVLYGGRNPIVGTVLICAANEIK